MPLCALCLPISQRLHNDCPDSSPYLPLTQEVHTSEVTAACVELDLPVGQSLHSTVPVSSE